MYLVLELLIQTGDNNNKYTNKMNTKNGKIQKMQLEEKVTDEWVLKNAFGTAFLPDENAHNIVDDDTEIEVFLFTEKDGKIKATTALPKIEVDTYGWGIV